MEEKLSWCVSVEGAEKTKSGKDVWLTHQCQLTGRLHGLYLNRDNKWVATSWDDTGRWRKGMDTSMDLQ